MSKLTTILAGALIGMLTTQAKAEYVKVSDDLTIHYETAGTGSRVVLLVPGWTMTTRAFSKQLEHYAGSKDYKVKPSILEARVSPPTPMKEISTSNADGIWRHLSRRLTSKRSF